jgi:plastocyanin
MEFRPRLLLTIAALSVLTASATLLTQCGPNNSSTKSMEPFSTSTKAAAADAPDGNDNAEQNPAQEPPQGPSPSPSPEPGMTPTPEPSPGASPGASPNPEASPSPSATPTTAATTEISMTNDMKFSPAAVNIRVGGTVTWTNSSSAPHTVTLDPAKALRAGDVMMPAGATVFDSGTLSPRATYSQTFTAPGPYKYTCLIHEGSNMQGTINVVP